jgi:uncharacterized protein
VCHPVRAFAWFCGLLVLALLAIGLCTYPAWQLVHAHFDVPFHRVADRVGMLALLLGFILLARHLRLADRASLGYALPARDFLRTLGVALGLGVLTMTGGVAVMIVLGLLDFSPAAGLSAAALAGLILKRLLSGLAVALIEETFIRGAMFTAITRESGARIAIVLTSFLYAASHFVASTHIPTAEVGPGSGWTLLAGALHAFAQPAGIADAFLALLAVGVVLGLVRAATGNIAACIGLHAGWVWVMLVTHGLTRPESTAPLGFLLSRFDGFVGWLVLAWTVLLALPLWRFYAARAATSVRTLI